MKVKGFQVLFSRYLSVTVWGTKNKDRPPEKWTSPEKWFWIVGGTRSSGNGVGP